jgi:hypothetical protein
MNTDKCLARYNCLNCIHLILHPPNTMGVPNDSRYSFGLARPSLNRGTSESESRIELLLPNTLMIEGICRLPINLV